MLNRLSNAVDFNWGAVMLAALVLLPLPSSAQAASERQHRNDAGTLETMREILRNLKLINSIASARPTNPPAVNGTSSDAASRAEAEDAYTGIAEQAGFLGEHVEESDVATQFLAGTLERFALLGRSAYERRRDALAVRYTDQMVEICVACHTRLPSHKGAPGATDFLEANIDQLETQPEAVVRRVRLLVAGRRFASALALLERYLAAQAELDARHRVLLSTYLIIGTRVVDGYERMHVYLRDLSKRPGSAFFAPALAAWAQDIEHYRQRFARARKPSREPAGSDDELQTLLDHGRFVFDRARLLEATPPPVAAVPQRNTADAGSDTSRPDNDSPFRARHSAASFAIASGQFHRALQALPASDPRRSELYYKLGICENSVLSGHWLPQPELYFEQSILAGPQTVWAQPALEELRTRVMGAYGADSPGGLPVLVREHLGRLESLIARSESQ